MQTEIKEIVSKIIKQFKLWKKNWKEEFPDGSMVSTGEFVGVICDVNDIGIAKSPICVDINKEIACYMYAMDLKCCHFATKEERSIFMRVIEKTSLEAEEQSRNQYAKDIYYNLSVRDKSMLVDMIKNELPYDKPIELTEANIYKLLCQLQRDRENDEENKAYDYAIDFRGHKWVEDCDGREWDDKELSYTCAGNDSDMKGLAHEMFEWWTKKGESAVVDAECYWNDQEENMAETDDCGILMYRGYIIAYVHNNKPRETIDDYILKKSYNIVSRGGTK